MKTLLAVLCMLAIAPSVVVASVANPSTPAASFPAVDSLRFAQLISEDSTYTAMSTKRAADLYRGERPATDAPERQEAIQQSCSKTNRDCQGGRSMVRHGPSNTLGDGVRVGFASELGAVIAAMNEHNPSSIAEDREYMGVILQEDGHYFYTLTPGQRSSDRISIRLQRSILPRVTALWHTHGSAAREREYFSAVDTRSANSLNKRFYLGDHTGHLRVFEPGGKIYSVYQASRMGLPSRRGFASGKLIHDENGQAIEIAT